MATQADRADRMAPPGRPSGTRRDAHCPPIALRVGLQRWTGYKWKCGGPWVGGKWVSNGFFRCAALRPHPTRSREPLTRVTCLRVTQTDSHLSGGYGGSSTTARPASHREQVCAGNPCLLHDQWFVGVTPGGAGRGALGVKGYPSAQCAGRPPSEDERGAPFGSRCETAPMPRDPHRTLLVMRVLFTPWEHIPQWPVSGVLSPCLPDCQGRARGPCPAGGFLARKTPSIREEPQHGRSSTRRPFGRPLTSGLCEVPLSVSRDRLYRETSIGC